MIDWDAPDLVPLAELHAQAALLLVEQQIRDAEVALEALRWWKANPDRLARLVTKA